MLKKRLTDEIKVISLHDTDAIKCASVPDVMAYGQTRDLSVLKYESWEHKPALFTLSPLRSGMEHLVDDPAALLITHCSKVENADELEIKFETRNDRKQMKAECIKNIPLDIVKELAQVISDLASVNGVGVASPFSLPDTSWLDSLTRATSFAAIRARMVTTASDTPS
ncbi:MAG: hypothetical protein GY841_00115, partial [FCB group bacterium]|nr:hypothetical protein [FCB group bacterium]